MGFTSHLEEMDLNNSGLRLMEKKAWKQT